MKFENLTFLGKLQTAIELLESIENDPDCKEELNSYVIERVWVMACILNECANKIISKQRTVNDNDR